MAVFSGCNALDQDEWNSDVRYPDCLMERIAMGAYDCETGVCLLRSTTERSIRIRQVLSSWSWGHEDEIGESNTRLYHRAAP